MYIAGVVSTLRPDRISSADVIHVPRSAHTISVVFNPPAIDKNTGLPVGKATPLSDIFQSSDRAHHHTIRLRASLEHNSVGFPSGWGCLYWWTPPNGNSVDGEIRYRNIASVASNPRAWSHEAIRGAFQRSDDFLLSNRKPWSTNLFVRVLQKLGYADGIVTRKVFSPVLTEMYALRYMDQRRAQAATDPALTAINKVPALTVGSILPKPHQFDIKDNETDAIRVALNDTTPVRVFSDGAIHDENWAGAAAVLVRTDRGTPEPELKRQRVHLGAIPPAKLAINDAELAGLGTALWLAAMEERLDRVSIYADSQLALYALRMSAAKPGQWRLPDFALSRYDFLMRRHPRAKVTFRWVPSHVGVEGNELADDLAKEAAVPPKRPRKGRFLR